MATEFSLTFETDNAAFDDDPAGETVRILKGITEKIENGKVRGPVRDLNGNSIGQWFFSTPENDDESTD